jgi:hypothetical protein
MSEDRNETKNRLPSISRARIVQFAAYVGALSVVLYQVTMTAVWGGQDFFLPPIDLLAGFGGAALAGSLIGAIAAIAYFAIRWFCKLDE